MLRLRAPWRKLSSTCLPRSSPLPTCSKHVFSRTLVTAPPKIGPGQGDTVVIAMSGGVDSSVTASLLARSPNAYELKAVFMRNWDTRDENASDTGCEWEKDWEDVQRVCKVLDIPCEMIDLSKQYWNRVFEPALAEWADGHTPNPDVSCNKEIKFGALMDAALSSPNQWLATGHYAQVSWASESSSSSSSSPYPRLFRAVDRNKDQTYYLSSVPESKLHRALFPIGHLTKPEVRDLAKKWGLPTATRSESMGICFVGQKQRFDTFLSNYLPDQPGPILSISGEVLGEHKGLWSLTIGQGARIAGANHKMYVAKKDLKRNAVIVVDRNDHPLLLATSLRIPSDSFNWIHPNHDRVLLPELASSDLASHHPSGSGSTLRVTAQIRHRMQPVHATLVRRVPASSPPNLLNANEGGQYELTFDEPQHAVAEGQILVIWIGEEGGDRCLGSGRIGEVRTLAEVNDT